jgi:hypothetical protein
MKGGVRLDPIVKNMLDALKIMYPSSTLKSVANEILKLTGNKKSGGTRKKTSAYDIAKYVIATIGIVLAIALAVAILGKTPVESEPIRISHEPYTIDQTNYHRPRTRSDLSFKKEPTPPYIPSQPVPKKSDAEIQAWFDERQHQMRKDMEDRNKKFLEDRRNREIELYGEPISGRGRKRRKKKIPIY